MKPFLRSMLGTAILVTAACGDSVTEPVVTSVTVAPDSVLIPVSDTVTLTVTASDAGGAPVTGQTVIWTSNDPEVASVTAEGVVTAVSPGNALVQATVRGIRGTARVTVTPGPVALLVISPDTAVVDSAAPRSFEALVEDAFGNEVPDTVVWSSSNPAVATVDPATGEATGVAPGTTLIIATAGAVADTAELDVFSLAFVVISAGAQHTCAASAGLSVYCWGGNNFGVLGNGSTTGNQLVPTRVPGTTEFVGVAAGLSHTCGRTRAGAPACWGRNNSGQIGDNTTGGTKPTPTFSVGNLQLSTLRVGDLFSCGIAVSGAGFCWGNNASGQTSNPIGSGGLGAPPPIPLPTQMQSSPSFNLLSLGSAHGCGLTSTGLANCWGDGQGGALGEGATATRSSPVQVDSGFSYISIAAGDDYTCGITAAGTAYCWGTNGAGQLGTGDFTNTLSPVAVNTGLTFTSIAAGDAHTCAVTAAGAAYCWGDGVSGQLGDGLNTPSAVPTAVSGGLSFASLTVHGSSSCGITTQGIAYCWGRNNQAQLGDGTMTDAALPVRVAGQ